MRYATASYSPIGILSYFKLLALSLASQAAHPHPAHDVQRSRTVPVFGFDAAC